MDSRIYRQVFGNFPESRTVFHHLLPCHNLLSLDVLKTVSTNLDMEYNESTMSESSTLFPFHKRFSYKSDVSTALYPGSGRNDRACELVRNKLVWKEKLTFLRPKNIAQALRYLKSGRAGKILEPNSVVQKYLEHFKHDPEPEFEGDYNWLYTGGNLDGFAVDNRYYIVSADEVDGFAVLNVIEFDSKLKKLGEKSQIKNKYYLTYEDPILQIVCSYNDHRPLVVLRQKKQVTLLNLDDNGINKIWSHKINYPGILTSCDINVDAGHLATVDNHFCINVYDIITGKEVITLERSAVTAPWSQVLFNCSSSAIYLADQTCLNILDLRVDSKASVVYKPTPLVNDCEVLCNVIKNTYSDHVFHIATSHNLIEVDIRNGKPIQRWTHLMKAAPQFGVANYGDSEGIIVLQSENPDEVVGIENTRTNEGMFISKSSPCVFETVKRELRLAQYSGMCFHPSLNERLNFTVTGLHMYRDTTGRYNLFTTNGGGDIMLSRLRQNEADKEESGKGNEKVEGAFESIRKYEEHCIDLHSRRMIASEMVDMRGAVRELRKKTLKRKKPFSRRNIHWPYTEKFSPESLCYYKDFMAERILHVWGVQMKNFWDDDSMVEKDDDVRSEAVVRAKVENWMKDWQTPS